MELLTRNNFENWMQKVMERLDRQDEMLLSMQPSGKAPNPMNGIRLFDNQQAHPATLPQHRRAALQDARQKDLLQRGGRADVPLRTCKGLPQGRYSLLQGPYP